MNHNGGGPGIAVPSAAAQTGLFKRTVAAAGLAASDIDVIEGHGTGTALSSPIELETMQRVYGTPRVNSDPVLIGSVKSNLGHAQAASGMLGVIKILMCGLHGRIVPTLYADSPTQAIDWENSGIALASRTTKWEPHKGIRRAAVSSFGITGANAHLITALPEQD